MLHWLMQHYKQNGKNIFFIALTQKIQYIVDVLYFFIVSALRRDLRVGAVSREQNALPYKAWKNAEFAGKVRR